MVLRRLGAAGIAAAAAFSLAACGLSVSTRDQVTEAGTETTDVEQEKIKTKEGEKVTLRVVDWSDSTKARREAFNKKFMEENPGVTVEYTVLTADQFKESVISSIKSGDAPDLFPLPSGVNINTAVEENWFVPLTGYLGEDFFAQFAEGSFNEGVTNVDGKVYGVPEAANIVNTLIFYNKTVLEDAGVTELPATWSEFKEACETVTKAGGGKYYGLIDSGAQTNRLELFIRSLASTAGAKCGDMSQIILVDGKSPLNSDAMRSAFAFYDSLVKGGCIHPDSITLKAPEARALFAQNQAAFICQGAWCISTWKTENPDLDFGVMAMPVPDSGAKGKLPHISATAWMGISANSKHPDVAARYLEGLYSEDYQSGLVEDGGFVSVINSVNEKYMTDEQMLEYYKLNDEAAVLVPDPIIGNPQAATVYAAAATVSPGLGEILQGVLAQSVDYEAQLADLAEKTQAEWEGAIQKAADAGADVGPEDFSFANWEPMTNYTSDMYESR